MISKNLILSNFNYYSGSTSLNLFCTCRTLEHKVTILKVKNCLSGENNLLNKNISDDCCKKNINYDFF